ncbi:MAG TPA: thioredoxin domain-containing protein [Gemmatimonadales bacterium]
MGTNRLGAAGSAYLRSAAHQPVHWFPWGAEAFAAAAAADKPVLLDIGAVWCHWCHVMDGESYEDPALAAFLNQEFVCVKVDRDERPDVDARYQRAVQAITRQGGWPLTGFLTPAAELFFGGTYFPPSPQRGQPSFREVLTRILAVWREARDRVESQARALREVLTAELEVAVPGTLSELALDDATHRILATADRTYGGFGSQPKFPHPVTIEFLLHRWCDDPDPTVSAVIHETLDGMANGGFRDLLGGGFHRYSVDDSWTVPHFEKLSSDNAELLRTYAEAGALFRKPAWLAVAAETVRWVREVLADPGGGFAASQDADVGLDDDGDYFTWSLQELGQLFTGAALELAVAHFGIGTRGRMPHAPERNVLFRNAAAGDLAGRLGQSEAAVSAAIATIEEELRAARGGRPTPFVDRTRYANWNAMLAGALLRAGPLLGDPWCAEAGLAALRRIREEQEDPATVRHTAAGPAGLLDDPVHCAAAALDAFELTGELSWLAWSEVLMDRVWEDHWDPEAGGFHDIAKWRDKEGLLTAAVKPIQDSPNASPNGVAGQCMARLFEHTMAPRWHDRHEALVTVFGASAALLGLFASAHLLAADWLVRPATHLVITGPADDQLAGELHRLALNAFVPRRVVVRLRPGDATGSLPPALRTLAPIADRPRGYLCVGTRCLAPVDSRRAWSAALRSVLPGSPEGKLHPAPES